MAKNVQVSSVTPKAKVKASTEKEKASTRKTIGLIASVVPAGKALKTVASAGKVVRKIQGKQMVERTKKAVNTVADIQQKVKAETIAKNSVKVKPASSAANRLEKNSMAKAKADTAKTGAMARYEAGQIEKKRQLPSKVIKINSKNK
jgi:predicted nucleic acid binding AN1-type Zn finger protein